MIQLVAELTRAQGRQFDPYLPQLFKIGIPIDALIHCGVETVRVDGGFFVPDPDGTPGLVLPCFEFGHLVDLVCLFSRDRWFARTGDAVLLGDGALDELFWDEPLRVRRTPLSWLHSECDGVCIVGSWAIARLRLPNRQLVAEDRQHAAELEALLTTPPPTILVELPGDSS